ncbi:MAG: hypothetical protein EOM53_06210 [Alphaproteobacteria bacterium]|nr:hypothetical protein [Alphaproteobacteria bacterium]
MIKKNSALKRFYWLNVGMDFFQDPAIKKLRKTPHGDTSTCIYLKLMLSTLETNGTFLYEHIEDSLEKEVALRLDEKVEDVKALFEYLIAHNLLSKNPENEHVYVLNEAKNMIGSESESTQRVRKFRAKALHGNDDVTERNGIVTPCNLSVTACNDDVTPCNETVTECNADVTLPDFIDVLLKDGK